MNLQLDEDERAIQAVVRKYLDENFSVEDVRALQKEKLGFSKSLWKDIATMGWFGLCLPEEFGGQDRPLHYFGLVMEQIGRHLVPGPFGCTMTAAMVVSKFGTGEQKRLLLPGVIDGDVAATYAFQEESATLDWTGMNARARSCAGGYEVSGRKLYVENFEIANYCLVATRSPDGQGISLFLVDTESPGISFERQSTLARDQICEVVFEVRVPESALLGQSAHAHVAMAYLFDVAVGLHCSQMAGAARKDAELAFAYSKARVAFGKPIGSFQSIQHLCADMLIAVDGMDLLTREAMWRLGEGLPASVEISQAKSFVSDKAMFVARSAQQIHGGIGFLEEIDLQLWYRRLMAWALRLGSSREHRSRVAQAILDGPEPVRLGREQDLTREAPHA